MKLHTRQLMGFLLLLLFLSPGLVAQQGDGERFSALIKNVRVNGVELHYLEKGSGMPVVLIHGGLGDYREWNPQIERISSHYRVIVYSRRYNYPNNNAEIPPDHSAIVEARDLAALLDALKLERVHIVGYSYGALTALFFATEHPERVRSLTLAEPPILGWLSEIPGGQTELDKFMQTMWRPAGEALQKGEPERALRITCDYFSGKGSFDQVPAEFRQSLVDNIREWKALTTSRDAFPPLSREVVKSLKLPILHVMVVGVAPEAQGTGIGRALLRPMIDRADAAAQPCYLETAQPTNVAFYEKLGFDRVVDTREPQSGLRLWTFRHSPLAPANRHLTRRCS